MNNDNANSIVIKLIYGSNSFLFTGDCDFVCEQSMISTKRELDSDVLKVSHHGSNNANSQAFLDLVSPSISVISVGPNSYGHPSQDVLRRLLNGRVLRTDELGTITIKSNGEKLIVE
jgi:competence protein ComEC